MHHRFPILAYTFKPGYIVIFENYFIIRLYKIKDSKLYLMIVK